MLDARCWMLIAGCGLASFFGLTVHAHAQETAVLYGSVYDAQTGAPLPGCNIAIAATPHGVASDENGKFQITNVALGRVTLVASFIGYQSQSLLLALDRPEVRVEIRLQPQALASPPVIVLAVRAHSRESPVTFSTIAPADLQQRYFAQDIPAVLSELPGTTFYSESGNNIGYNYLSIRGFEQRRISVLINGVPQNDPEDHNVYWIDFPDLLGNTHDVQVQRGAGSAFYGPPAIGGAVNITTANFSPRRKLEAYAGSGSYGTRKYSLALHSGWLAEKFLFFGRFSRIQSDGYREQSWSDLKSYFFGAAHVSKKSITRAHLFGGPIADHLTYYGIPKTLAGQRDTRRQNPITRPDEIENFNQPQLQLLHEYRLGENLRWHNTLFGMRGYGFFDYNGNWAPLSYFRLTPEFGFAASGNPDKIFVDSLLIRAYVDNRQIGWLPHLAWQHARGEVTVGVELRRHRSLHWGRIQQGDDALPPAIAGEYRGRNYIGARRYYEYRGGRDVVSPFAHANYRLRPRLNFSFDLQFVNLRYRLFEEKFLGTDFSLRYHFWNPRAGGNYNINDRLNLYASVARTNREPRLKNFYDAAEASTPASWGAITPQFERRPEGGFDFNRPLIRPEKLYDYEMGFGYHHERGHAALNFFYMNFKNEIIKSGQLDPFGQPVTVDAGRTLHAGLEMQAEIKPFAFLTLSGNFMFSQNELKEYEIFMSESRSVSLRGNAIAGFPDFLANLRLTYAGAGFTASVALQHSGKKYTDNFGDRYFQIFGETRDNTVAPYTVFHGTASYACDRLGLRGLTLQAHVQNLFNTLYIAHGEGADFFPAAERQMFVNVKYTL